MIRIVVDLEMNRVAKQYKEVRRIDHYEIIEIGAVAVNDVGKKVGMFKILVKPQFNDVIVPNIERLTGITTEMVSNAKAFEEAFDDFMNWCNSFEESLEFYEWSESDYLQICKELRMKDIAIKDHWAVAFHSWIDFQKSYGELLGLDRAISLSQAVDYAGFDFSGRQHDALFDADNTAELLILSMDKQSFASHMKAVLDVLKPSAVETTLGDLFDFSSIVLQGAQTIV